MPLYSYKCKSCELKFDRFVSVEKMRNVQCLQCGGEALKLITLPSIQTDTNFGYTGKYDPRLDSVVEGRKDWKRKLKEKGLIEVDRHYGQISSTTTEERIKKAGAEVN